MHANERSESLYQFFLSHDINTVIKHRGTSLYYVTGLIILTGECEK